MILTVENKENTSQVEEMVLDAIEAFRRWREAEVVASKWLTDPRKASDAWVEFYVTTKHVAMFTKESLDDVQDFVAAKAAERYMLD